MIPTDRIPMKDLRGYLEWPQVLKLINAPDNLRDRSILRILSHTGCRVSEALALYRKHIIWTERILIMPTLKRRKGKHIERRVPIDRGTLKLLKGYLSRHNGQKIFPITRQQVFNIVRNAGKRVGIINVGEKRLHPHHLRHSFAIHYVKAGFASTAEGLRKLQMMLGHANIATTAIYLQFSPTDLREEYDKLFKEGE